MTGQHGQRINIRMALTWMVLDREVVLLQSLKPAGKLSFSYLEISEPSERTVVSLQNEVITQQVRVEVQYKGNYS